MSKDVDEVRMFKSKDGQLFTTRALAEKHNKQLDSAIQVTYIRLFLPLEPGQPFFAQSVQTTTDRRIGNVLTCNDRSWNESNELEFWIFVKRGKEREGRQKLKDAAIKFLQGRIDALKEMSIEDTE